MNHRRASTGGNYNIKASTSTTSTNVNTPTTTTNIPFTTDHNNYYPSSPEKTNHSASGYYEEGDSDEHQQHETMTIITYHSKTRTTRRASFSGPITRRRCSTGQNNGNSSNKGSSNATGNHSNNDVARYTKVTPTRTVSSSSNKSLVVEQAPITIQTSKGINPEIVARMSISQKNGNSVTNSASGGGLMNVDGDDDDDDDDEDDAQSPQQVRRGYAATMGNHHHNGGGMDALYGLGNPSLLSSSSSLVSHSKNHNNSSQKMTRRGSNASSVHSKSSRISRRRSSLDRRTFKSKDPIAAMEVYSSSSQQNLNHNPNNTKASDYSVYDTDDHDDDDDDAISSDDDNVANNGNGPTNTTTTNNMVDIRNFGYESDLASEHSQTGSMSSSKRSRRRNSCIIRNDHDLGSVLGGSVIAMHNRSRMVIDTDDDNDDDEEEEDDPDSLFNRAKRRSQSIDMSINTSINATPKDTKRVIVSKNHDSMEFDESDLLFQKTATNDITTTTATMKGKLNNYSEEIHVKQQQQQQPSIVPVSSSSLNDIPTTVTTTKANTIITTSNTKTPKGSSSTYNNNNNNNNNSSTMDYTTEPWRKSPLTVSYQAPTEENLRANLKNMLRIDKFSGNHAMTLSPTKHSKTQFVTKEQLLSNEDDNNQMINHNQRNNAAAAGGGGEWGDLNFPSIRQSNNMEDDEYDHNDKDDSSYGANMYTDTMVYTDEIDMYQQKARRRASLENTHYDIDTVYQSKGIKVPHFKPADGCRNASDFVVRCFTARMRISGFTVLKHNRSRWSKAKNRIIYLLPDNQTLSWRESDDETLKTNKSDGNNNNNHHNKNSHGHDKDGVGDLGMMRLNNNSSSKGGPKIDLTKCIEVRYACSIDPKNPKKRGTPVLRSRCKDEFAGKSFSLIFANRTLDLTAFSNDQCKVLMEGFSALCFRLHLQRMEGKSEHNNSSDTDKHLHDDQCTNVDDDWASTMFGGSTTNTSVSYPVGPVPWGR